MYVCTSACVRVCVDECIFVHVFMHSLTGPENVFLISTCVGGRPGEQLIASKHARNS